MTEFGRRHMRIVLTGSSGRVGRAIFSVLAGKHDVFGIDRSPFATTHLVGDFANEVLLRSAFEDADAVIHVAALHAPHVGIIPDEEFHRINVGGTRLVAEAAIAAGVRRLVFTSTTALYGSAVSPTSCTWIDEDTPPQNPHNLATAPALVRERSLVTPPKRTIVRIRVTLARRPSGGVELASPAK